MLKLAKFKTKQRIVFEWTEDLHGSDGWVMKGQPTFTAVEGMGLAHDCLEHFTHIEDGAESEYTAFGVIFWGRLSNDYNGTFKPYIKSPDWLAADLGQEIAGFVRDLGVPSIAEGFDKPLFDEETERVISLIVGGIRDTLAFEFEADEIDVESTIQSLVSWLRYGYMSAEESYGDKLNGVQFVNTFFGLEMLIDDYYNEGEFGDVLVVDIDRSNGLDVKVRRGMYDNNGRIRYTEKADEV